MESKQDSSITLLWENTIRDLCGIQRNITKSSYAYNAFIRALFNVVIWLTINLFIIIAFIIYVYLFGFHFMFFGRI